ncbi:hypothetical protein K440DRAFT_205889 [Wilcoxina mikolae CBS 423.85]|nr:hypothetical protein K440DRAFT_205889 [Wilcoxina mikolae CBS 423.85]
MAPIIPTNRADASCDACNDYIDDCPLVHFLEPGICNHIFHLDCLIDKVLARGKCPICRVTVRKAEMAKSHNKTFHLMKLVDIFEEGIMRANRRRLRVAGAFERREFGATKAPITSDMMQHS